MPSHACGIMRAASCIVPILFDLINLAGVSHGESLPWKRINIVLRRPSGRPHKICSRLCAELPGAPGAALASRGASDASRGAGKLCERREP
jgi:hypothetical protein